MDWISDKLDFIKTDREKIWKKLLFISTVGYTTLVLSSQFSPLVSAIFIIPLLAAIVAGRFDLVVQGFTKILVTSAFIIQFCLFGINIYQEYYSLNFNYFDTGFFWNPVANFANGHGFFNSELGASEFSDHFCAGLLIFTPLVSIFQNAVVLSIFKLLSFGLSFWFLFQLLKYYKLEQGIRNFILFLWFMNLGVVNFMGFEFQSSNLIVPLVFLLFRLYQQEKYFWSILVAFFLLTLKENGALVLISLGIFSFLYLNKPKSGIIIALTGGFLLWFIPFFLMPFLAGTPNTQASGLDPFCCISNKASFGIRVLLCSGFFLAFHPRALLVVLPSMAVSFLINRSGAHSLSFHYQDIPLAISFSVLGFLFSEKNENWRPAFLKFPILRLAFAFFFCLSLYQNRYGANFFLQSNQPTQATENAVKAIELFRKQLNPEKTIWAQSSLAFYLSSEFRIKCIMNSGQTLSDESPNYVVLCDHSSVKWPIDSEYEALKTSLKSDAFMGKRVLLKGFEPLIIYQQN